MEKHKKNYNKNDILEEQKANLQAIVDEVNLRDSVMRTFRFKEGSQMAELSELALARLDDIDNAVYNMLQEIVEDDTDLDWDMSIIGPIAEYAISLLKQAGHKVSYPGMVVNTDGTVEYEE